ncbi:PREDICTED: uncharacterized protein LOC109236800 isoform X1 [Nicotiana attenuata]|uniref:uncharacterized protein LOC109236800 isoform X1 n=1 Tax=Nicotiana attenuata TaxID=49451 RepID=UPI0009048740|nr:PREDICTED: uncharacterized protein LOC109236800 isoform X1 [Nicotiana attenuata]
MYEIIERGNIEAMIAAEFIQSLVNLIQTLKVGELDPVRVETIIYAAVATINIVIASGNGAHIKYGTSFSGYLADISCIEVLCDFIASRCSEKFMRNSVRRLEKILEVGAKDALSIDYVCRIEKKIESIHAKWYHMF